MGLAEGGNGRDAITKPVRLRAGRTAPLGTEEALRCARTWAGPRKPPRAAALPGEPGKVGARGGPGHPPWTVRSRALPLRAGGCGAKRKRSPGILRPQPSSDSQKHTPVPIFLYPSPNGRGLAYLPIVRVGRQSGGRAGEFFLILENASSNSKSLNRGIKGHSSSPSLSRVKIF